MSMAKITEQKSAKKSSDFLHSIHECMSMERYITELNRRQIVIASAFDVNSPITRTTAQKIVMAK